MPTQKCPHLLRQLRWRVKCDDVFRCQLINYQLISLEGEDCPGKLRLLTMLRQKLSPWNNLVLQWLHDICFLRIKVNCFNSNFNEWNYIYGTMMNEFEFCTMRYILNSQNLFYCCELCLHFMRIEGLVWTIKFWLLKLMAESKTNCCISISYNTKQSIPFERQHSDLEFQFQLFNGTKFVKLFELHLPFWNKILNYLILYYSSKFKLGFWNFKLFNDMNWRTWKK